MSSSPSSKKKSSATANGSSSSTPKPTKTRSNTPVPPYDFGKTIEEAITKFDGPGSHEKVVFACFAAGARQQWAEHLRKMEIEREHVLSEAEIQEARELWRPSVKRRGQHAHIKASKIVGKLSADEKAALLAALSAE